MSSKDYEVGYGRPPKHTRFRKGQPSANPNGRPKTRDPLDVRATLEAALKEEVLVGGRNVSKLKLLADQLAAQAARGNRKAANLLLGLIPDIAPAPSDTPCGVLVVEPYMTPDEWEAWAGQFRAPLDPVALLPGLDHAAMNRALAEKEKRRLHGYDDSNDPEEG
jgi:hypothetical protein